MSLTKLNSTVLPNGQPYTILSKVEKHLLSTDLALMGLCCSTTISIYWVALTELERAFHITEEQVNLTVTAYLVFQAISPVFVSNASDHWGRRPILLICLAGGFACNAGIASCNSYWLLILLRCILSIFLSPIASISSSVIGDYTTGRNRGGVSGVVSGFVLIGQGIGPFIGSLFDNRWNWRAIFWFCAIYQAFVLVLSFFVLPETKRSFAGNLSYKPDHWYHWSPVLWYLGKSRLTDTEGITLDRQLSPSFNPFAPFALVKELDISLTLIPGAILYATWTMTQASLSTTLAKYYHYHTLKIGLCFFAPGIATIIGSITSGIVLDRTYKKMKRSYIAKYGDDPNRPPFNIIKSRLLFFPYYTLLVAAFTLLYGWASSKHLSVALILVGSFFISIGTMHPLNTAMTLMVDLHPEKSGASTSMNNLFRCGFGAIFISCLTDMNKAMTLGGTYTFMAGLCILCEVDILGLLKMGEKLLLSEARKKEKQDH